MKLFLRDILGPRKKKKPDLSDQAMPTTATTQSRRSSHTQAVELGTIDYVNLTPDRKHGDYDTAVQTALQTGKPLFANFVEWSG